MNDLSELNSKLNSPKILQSTKVINGIGYDYTILSTLGEIKTMFGDETLTTNDISVSAMNGDWNFQQIRVTGTAWQEYILLVFFANNLTQNHQVRINMTISIK